MFAQLDLDYQLPPEEILQLADVNLPPSTLIDSKGEILVLVERNQYKSIEELSQPELRLGGLRINPRNNTGSRTQHFTGISIQKIGKGEAQPVKDLPESPKLSNFAWSPDETKIAALNTTPEGAELWVVDIPTMSAKRMTSAEVHANMYSPFTWSRDSKFLLVRMLPEDRSSLIDRSEIVPSGPKISINDGQKAQNRTYQDLLKDKVDEANFKTLAQSAVYKVPLEGKVEKWKDTDMHLGMSFSPDGSYVMISSISKPFSYLVPYYRFPTTYAIYDQQGSLVKVIEEVPLIEELPQGFGAVRQGRRSIQWRTDKPATLVWVEALDGGDPAKEVAFRDEVFALEAPFEGEAQSLIKTVNRYAGITWGNDELAMAYDRWFTTRNTKTYQFNPSDPNQDPQVIYDRNYQDRYSSPGSFATRKNKFGRAVLAINNGKLTLTGSGYSPEGVFPFVDERDIESGEVKRLWQAEDNGTLERIYEPVDVKRGIFLTRIEAPDQFPNYYLRDVDSKKEPKPLTNFENPFKSLEDAHKEVITYERYDGVELSGVLYLPPGYDKEKKEKLPMVMWAYPVEYKDKQSGGQVTSSPYEFTYVYYGSPVFWLTQGYAILDDAAFPIVGEGGEEPNDDFRKQLVGNAKAAIDAVDQLGYIDPNRVAVGGHSYGAFMTANLLSHSDLFAAGIARSGAYNRTLTPFGFQREERNYWEAPEVYYRMSPFMHAEKMKTPLLLIHGMEDNNSGTYPMQSERYFNALKGLGATVRLVMLPEESHGYAARESILHVLWEQDQWLEKYVKNRKMPEPDQK